MTRQRQARRPGRSGVGTGTISLLMIFTVLCFATLAMLSLSTASSNANMQQRGLERTAATEHARGVAAKAVAELDGLLAGAKGASGTDKRYADASASAAEGLGFVVDGEAGTATLRTRVDERSELVTVLQLHGRMDTARYTVLSQGVVLTEGWKPDDGGQLWIPD